ncbi:MAG: hypothetical protein D6767_07590 [Candidatus Hydrogenedentota bacterium]|nr:MAG: hypothetical protein D6767_07590 [Candidatus Hydrogenedentota bacterium]
MQREIEVIAKIDNKTSTGKLIAEEIPESVRKKSALKIGGLLFLLALAAVFIPILHFVLVPGLMISSFVGAYMQYKKAEKILQAEIACPNCSSPLEVTGTPKFPLHTDCRNCMSQVTILEKK